MIEHNITEETYFSPENSKRYMGVSQFKEFLSCEAKALDKLNNPDKYAAEENSTSLLVGSYVDAHFSGTLPQFKATHPQLFLKSGGLKSDYIKAEECINRMESDPLMMKYLDGEKQVIMVGTVFGVEWKIKIDVYHKGKCIVDMKCMKDTEDIWDDETKSKLPFITKWGYDLQAYIYQEVVRQNVGLRLPFILAVVTKEVAPQIKLIHINDNAIDAAGKFMAKHIDRVVSVKNGTIPPERCEHCNYCYNTKVLTPDDIEEFDYERIVEE